MDIYYTKDHEWIKVEGNTGTVGISEYAAKQLGDITFVELPEPGKTVKQGELLCEVESVKAASDINAPVSGSVKEVNTNTDSFPAVVSSVPESDGWICRMEITDPGETANLMNKEQYSEYIKTLK